MKTLTTRLTLFFVSLQITLVYIIAWGFESFMSSAIYNLLLFFFVIIMAFSGWLLGNQWEKENPMYLTGNLLATLKDYQFWIYTILTTIFLLAIFYITSEFLLPEGSITKRLTFNGNSLLGFIMTLIGGLIAYTIPIIGIYTRLKRHWE